MNEDVYEDLKARFETLKASCDLKISSDLMKEASEQPSRYGEIGYLKAGAVSYYESSRLMRETWEHSASLAIRTASDTGNYPYELADSAGGFDPTSATKLTEGFIQDIVAATKPVQVARRIELSAKNLLSMVSAFEAAYEQRNWMLRSMCELQIKSGV